MKLCRFCKVKKDISKFYEYSKAGKIYTCTWCKSCMHLAKRNWAARNRSYVCAEARKNYYDNWEERKRKHRDYLATSIGRESNLRSAIRLRRKKDYIIKDRARNKMEAAIVSNKLLRRPCVRCGNPRSEGHHENYEYPLEVVWLCRQHHAERHRKYV